MNRELLAQLMQSPNVTSGAASPAIKPTGASVDRNRMLMEILSQPVETPRTPHGSIAPVDATQLAALANIGTSMYGAHRQKKADAESRELLARELAMAGGGDPFQSELQPIESPVLSGRVGIRPGSGADEAVRSVQEGVLPFVEATEATRRGEQKDRSEHDLAALLDPRASGLTAQRLSQTGPEWGDAEVDEATGSLVQRNARTGEVREVSRAPSAGGADSAKFNLLHGSGRDSVVVGAKRVYTDSGEPVDVTADPIRARMTLVQRPDGSVVQVWQDMPMGQGATDASPKGQEIVTPQEALSGTTERAGAEAAAKEGGVSLTPGQKAVDTKFADDYVQWQAVGGFADVQKNLSQLQEVKKRLESGKEQLTGTAVGNTPRAVLAATNPAALDTLEQVEEVIQRNLRLILGAQFTEKEGERLISRGYNPRLGEADNAVRIGRLIQSLEDAAKSKDSAAQYFAENGTLAGWTGKLFTMSDFQSAVDAPAETDVAGPETVDESDPLSALTPEQRKLYGLD
jgi:hypothetical protein